jgi:hypothetical protein
MKVEKSRVKNRKSKVEGQKPWAQDESIVRAGSQMQQGLLRELPCIGIFLSLVDKPYNARASQLSYRRMSSASGVCGSGRRRGKGIFRFGLAIKFAASNGLERGGRVESGNTNRH